MYWLPPWMAKCNNIDPVPPWDHWPLVWGLMSQHILFSLRGSLAGCTVAISAKACLDQSLLQLSYQQCRLERTTPSKITKTGVEVYLKARSRRVTIPVVDSVSQTYRFAPLQYSFRIKSPLNCKL